MTDAFAHLPHIKSHDDLTLYELIPNVVWIFDLDRHGWWWGNEAAIKFWNLQSLDELVAKDLSDDTQGARDRTKQTFDLAVKNGLTIDPWTTYPQGKPKTLYMMHRAVLVGPERHRAIIAYINEEVNLGEVPENLLLVEAMRYTTVLVTSFTLEGEPLVENPAATETYRSIDGKKLPDGVSTFAARFADAEAGQNCLDLAIRLKGGRWTHVMKTDHGLRTHTLDIRMTRHPLNGDTLLLVAEDDVTPLHEAIEAAERAQDELRQLAHYDSLTGLPSPRLLDENSAALLANARRNKRKIGVMFVDLDGFKKVNDTWGHEAGDFVLKEVARRLLSTLRECDQTARVGGDEFVVLVSEVDEPSDAEQVAAKIIAELAQPIELNAVQGKPNALIGASIGIAFFPDHGDDLKGLIKAADQSMYQVKKQGKGHYNCAS